MHIHELEFAIHCCAGVDAFRKVIPHIDQFVAVSQMVEQNLRDNWHIPAPKIARIPAFIQEGGTCRSRGTGEAVRQRLGIPRNAFVVGGCGPVEWHKGTDLFVLVAKEVIDSKPPRPVHFVWLGANENAPTFLQVQMDLKKLGLLENVHFLGCQPNPMDYFDAFDVLLLTSREDSFPLVCLENAVLGNPVLCFDRAVGSTEYVDDTCGHVSPYMDTSDMAQTVLRLCHDSETCYAFAQRIRQKVQKYTVDNCGKSILQVIEALAGTSVSATGPSHAGKTRCPPAGQISSLPANLATSPGSNDA